MHPIVLGKGEHLFPDGTAQVAFQLIRSSTFENGVVHVTYALAEQ